jgi:NADPH:quinone reductase-like Zn-dependent oxidoreductase
VSVKTFELTDYGVDNLRLVLRPDESPGSDEVLLHVRAISLNYRDLATIEGSYNRGLNLPAVLIADCAGTILETGANVHHVKPGDKVMTQYMPDWIDGPYRDEYQRTTLGSPGPGVAAERVVLPGRAVLPMPRNYSFAEASTLPIAGLTAWSSLATAGPLEGKTVVVLGTGGVSIFGLQLATAMGAQVVVTSKSDEKLARARELGAALTVNYVDEPDWHRPIREFTGGSGADLILEAGGSGTLPHSIKATRSGGVIALFGVLTGGAGEIETRALLSRRITIAGIYVDSRSHFDDLVSFLNTHEIRPVIGAEFPFEQLPDALRMMRAADHFGKIVIHGPAD